MTWFVVVKLAADASISVVFSPDCFWNNHGSNCNILLITVV